ncbi:MAG: hypothetical protein MUO72_13525 [Bacteroidales bacterium]|nr:hypothetical protein [Bacteroidales bacterium]
MEFNQRIICEKLQKLPENEVTKKFIMPLLESIGFFKVEFYGGVSEGGKDILCWELDKMDEIRLTVAQVKHFKFTNLAKGGTSLQTIINQLINCFTTHLPYIDKSTHLPSEAILISTYEIDTKTLQSRFGTHPILWDYRIRIIDGPKLVSMLVKKKPELLRDILGVDLEITSKLSITLNNELLLKALGYQNKVDIKSIYTDIDFSLGKISTELFFDRSFKPKRTTIGLRSINWQPFRLKIRRLNQDWRVTFLNKTVSKIEQEFKAKNDKYTRWTIELEYLQKKLKKITTDYNSTSDLIDEKRHELSRKVILIKNRKKQKSGKLNKKPSIAIEQQLLKVNKKYETIIKPLKVSLIDLEEHINEINIQIKNHKKKEIIPLYEFEIDGSIIAKEISEKRKWIEERVSEFNNKRFKNSDISDFIIKCKRIMDSTSIVFSNKYLRKSILDENLKAYRKNFDATRLKINIDRIFNTGLNIAVLGEAGAGKTTCLQMYALARQNDTSKLHIWVPLSRVIQDWYKIDSSISDPNKDHNLITGIANYLSNVGISISCENLIDIFHKQKVVLLLDGIDEAIKVTPWLLDGIKVISDLYRKNLQIIVSSRMSGPYLNKIPFFAITLLPFTDEQRDLFIERWFGEDRKEYITKIKEHLERSTSIKEIVKNPLLTTTLCVIAENNIPLPSTEIKLYNERLNLLTGYYDNVKNIVTRITSTPSSLRLLSQKLSYYFHSNSKRDEDYYILQELSIQLMLNKLSVQNSTNALNELIDPCNILVPMTDDGKFGFGHLRYQEYLAAEYIISNRNIDIIPLLKQPWWKEVLILFSQMNDTIKWLIQDIGNKSEVSSTKQILIDMINARPRFERAELFSLLDKYFALERLDKASNDIEYDDVI